MIRIVMAAATAAALGMSCAAFAATPSTMPAPAGTPAPAVHKTAMHAPYRDTVGDRETAALNTLEAKGYFDVKNIRAVGKNVDVDAKKGSADFVHLAVTPDGMILPMA